MPPPVLLHSSSIMDTSRQETPQTHDFADKSSLVEGVVAPDGKVPKKYTAQGTTPSGKPRLFVCGMCTRAFARLEHLRRHERSHTKEKPFDCGVCKRKFSRRDLLLRHAQKLHAGCDDAVARMRRKSSKSHSVSSTNGGTGMNSASGASGAEGSPVPTRPLSGASFLSPGAEPVNFNLNSFAGLGRSQDSSKSPATPTSRISRSNSVKDSGLKKQLFDKRKPRFRRASFSAQSGPNYAMPPSHYDSSTAENVEFSTPQLLPSFTSDEDSWLSNLCTIPGMSALKSQPVINEHTQAYSFENEFPKHTAILGGGMHQNLMRSDSIISSNSVNTVETPSGNPPFMSHRPSISGNTPSSQSEASYMKSELDEAGYSFYDIPESLTSRTMLPSGMARPLSPIRQELEDELMDLENPGQFMMKTMPVHANMQDVNYSHNHLNDLDDLDQFFDDGGKRLLGGYSFYGDNPSIASTGLESISSHASVSPSAIQAANPQLLAKGAYLNGNHYNSESHTIENQLENASFFENGYSRTTLFTKKMRFMIKKALSKYPISDVMSPTIPSNEKMEFFLHTFVERFLSYFPFIHPSKLNEFDIMDMTSDEDPQNESARICLPLLVATLGALLANHKNDSDQLYEASRRTVHIYLESRKSGKPDKSSAAQTNPLWLIQSLTLSVIYGLFSDSENNIYIVIRQLNALNSLVKTSLKNNHETFFIVSGQDQIIRNFAREGNWHGACEALNCGNVNELKFRHAIALQSQARSALTIYSLTNFILMMFNVPLTLSAAELGSLTCPNTNDEFLWGFNNYTDFAGYLQNMGIQRDLDFFLAKDDTNVIVFQDILKSLCQNQFDDSVSSKLMNMSKFGFNCLVKGIYEFMQYEDYNFMDIDVVLNYLTMFVDSSSRNPHTRYMLLGRNVNEKFDYALLVNFVKICSSLDFKMVKEQSWLKNYDVLNKNFHVFLASMENIGDFEFLKVIDHCVAVTRLVMFRIEGSSVKSEDSNSDFPNGRSGNDLTSPHDAEFDLEASLGLRVLDEVSCSTSPIHSQVLFHIFVIFSIFAVHVAKRNNPASLAAQAHNMNDTWQLNQKFLGMLKILAKFEDHLRVQFENHQLDSEMTNLFLLSSGNSHDVLLQNQGFSADQTEHSNVFAYSLDKALYVLRVGELMMRLLYEQNIKVVILKKLSGSMSQIRKYLIDEESSILP